MPPVPIASVVLPCFDAERTIGATIASACAQTVGEIEIIAVDDGSRDSTRGMLADIATRDPRVRIVTQVNSGVSAARNAGVRSARGAVIALLDSDDLWAPTHLETHLARFDADAALGVSFATARLIDTAGRVTGVARTKLAALTPVDVLASNPSTTCSTLVIRRRVFDEAGLFDETLRRNEDQEWLFRAALSRWKITGAPQMTVDYRTSTQGLASDLDAMLAGFERTLAAARRIAPDVVAKAEGPARAHTLRYLARRALRLGLAPARARGYLGGALKASPGILFTEPKATLAVIAAACIPGGNALVYGRARD